MGIMDTNNDIFSFRSCKTKTKNKLLTGYQKLSYIFQVFLFNFSELREAFNEFDEERSGEIAFSQVAHVARKLGLTFDPDELRRSMKRASGSMALSRYIPAFTRLDRGSQEIWRTA